MLNPREMETWKHMSTVEEPQLLDVLEWAKEAENVERGDPLNQHGQRRNQRRI